MFHGGAAIYRLTPCSAAAAFEQQPKREWQIPAAIRCIIPPPLLEAAKAETVDAVYEAEEVGDDARPF